METLESRGMPAGGPGGPYGTSDIADANGDELTYVTSRPSTRTSQRPGSAQSEYLESYLSQKAHEGTKRSARKSRSSSPHHEKDASRIFSSSASMTRRKALPITDVCAPPQEPVTTKQHKFPVTGSKPSCSDSLFIYR